MKTASDHITVERTARYFTLGRINSDTRSVTYVLHGYGHHPGTFIEWFRPVASDNHAVIAPEGLSRFYNEGIRGKVGASWMTSDDRENEIFDYQNYLNRLHTRIVEQAGTHTEFQLIGFSQGAATACRWLAGGGFIPARLVLWAGMFPPDLGHGSDHSFPKHMKIIQVLSEKDPFFEKGMLQNQKKYLNDLGVESELFSYDKGHKVYEDVLKDLYNQYVPWRSDLF